MFTFRRTKFLLLTLYFLTIFSGANWMWVTIEGDHRAMHRQHLDRFAEFISSKLDKYAHLPQLLAKSSEVLAALKAPNNTAQLDVTNRFLERVNDTIKGAGVYILNKNGNTIASSNWNLSHSFIGHNYTWRPYFSEAILGQPSQYFALGSSSKRRGYYFSHPIYFAGDIVGVIVVKMHLSAIEESWKDKVNTFVATDKHNVIFMSSNEKWLFKSLITLSASERQNILNSRQYLDSPIRSLDLSGDLSVNESELKKIKQPTLNNDYIVSSQVLDKHQLTLRVLTKKIHLLFPTLSFVIVVTLVFVIAFLCLQLISQRHFKKRQFEQIQSEAKQKLEFLVMERTAKLQAEITERNRTESRLKQTQDELIQAGKLAVIGQISASISHELNNPLTAIRSFSDNAVRFLEREKYQCVNDNLIRISELTKRMAAISNQLRSFAKKSDSRELHLVDVKPLILSARELLIPQLRNHHVELHCDIQSSLPKVELNPIQFEQVLINLVTNAIQAIESQEKRQIIISTHTDNEVLSIYVDDNGPGLKENNSQELFEPFFTTKDNGLGLGLSISRQIIQSMGGTLKAASSLLGGAQFIVNIPIKKTT